MLLTEASDGEAVAAIAAYRIANHINSRPHSVVALTGGSTPQRVYELLAQSDVDWSRVHIFQTDERIIDSKGSTLGLNDRSAAVIEKYLVTQISLPADHWHPMPYMSHNLSQELVSYDKAIRNLCSDDAAPDLVLLGLGVDGHTASLFGSMMSTDSYIHTSGPYEGCLRITLSETCLGRAGRQLLVAVGANKATAVQSLLQGGSPNVPAARVLAARGEVIVDRSAHKPSN